MTGDAGASSANDRLQGYIEEFRANAGRLGGSFEGVPVLLLHDRDAATGAERITPLTCQPQGAEGEQPAAWAVFASSGGAPTDPAWYRNLLAHPDVAVEFGPDTFNVVARVTAGEERDEIWTRQKRLMPSFAGYEERAGREIPVVMLEVR
jgi:deazaflavin-dependent oxidoreductase (nitroreductase family)